MSTFPKLSFVYDRYRKATSTKPAVIELRITYERKQKYISTRISVLPKQWKNGTVVGTPDAIQLNQQLDKLIADARKIILQMADSGSININLINSKLEQLYRGRMTLLDFIKQRAEVRMYGKSPDTQQRYERFIRLFNQYGLIKDFDDITEASVIAYDKHLASTGMKAYSKWNNYHRFLNSFIMDAMDAGYMKRNPYRWVNINRGQEVASSRYLTPKEFKKIMDAKMPTNCLERVRDLFVFQTYTCLSYTDLKAFDATKIVQIKGMKVYSGKRGKTNMTFTIPLLPTAIGILDKYQGKLPIISNVKYNSYLKKVAETAGVNKPVSTHWARHTGATMLLNDGVPLQVVSKICGHASTRITEKVYAKLLDETVVEAIKGLKL